MNQIINKWNIHLKMSSSPRRQLTREEKDARDNLDAKAFGDKLDLIVKHQTNLLKLASQVYSLDKSDRISYNNGKSLGRKELRSLLSQLNRDVKSLKKNYVAHGKRKRRTRAPGTTAGFKNPILVSDAMREFFRTANLGNFAVVTDEKGEQMAVPSATGTPLNSVLAVGTNGVTTRAIMTTLFNIYADVNRMQQDPKNRQFLTSTPEMDRYFAQTYQRLVAAPQRFTKPDKAGQRKPIPKFDPKHFSYARIQSVVADNTVKKEQLDPQQAAVLADQSTRDRLEQEQKIVSDVLAGYRARKIAARKATESKGRVGKGARSGSRSRK